MTGFYSTRKQMIYTTTTTTPLQTVKDELNLHSKDYGFGVLGSYDFKKILESKGLSLEKDITVYEVCNPKAGHNALTQISEISVFLPCRISVYEEDGKTTLSTIDISVVLDAINANDELREQIQETYDNLLKLMNSL